MPRNRLKLLRKECGLTQVDISKKLKVSRNGYQHWEAGTRTITAENLILLADFFNVNIDYILYRTDIKAPLKKSENPREEY